MMRKIYLAGLLLFALASCGKQQENALSLKGEIKGLESDTLYIYGTDLMHNRVDTLPVAKGKFNRTLTIDTLTMAWLQFNDGIRYPIFLDKGKQLTISGTAGDAASLQITGSQPNDELTTFYKELREAEHSSEADTRKRAEAFIRSHPSSVASIYLLEKYFVQTAQPDYSLINTLIEGMTGTLKDRPYIDKLSARVKEADKPLMNRTAPFIQMNNAQGERINRNSFKDQYILIHFWASWDSLSLKNNADLRYIYQRETKKKNKRFALWGISLDLDRPTWEATIKRDTLEWEQTCDFEGWNSSPVKQLVIHSLPANILLGRTGRIEGRDLTMEEIDRRLKTIQEEEEREKAEARKKKRNK